MVGLAAGLLLFLAFLEVVAMFENASKSKSGIAITCFSIAIVNTYVALSLLGVIG